MSLTAKYTRAIFIATQAAIITSIDLFCVQCSANMTVAKTQLYLLVGSVC